MLKSSSLEERWIVSPYVSKYENVSPTCQVCNNKAAHYWITDKKQPLWYMWLCSKECEEYIKLKEC